MIGFIQAFYHVLELSINATDGDVWGFVGIALILVGAVFMWFQPQAKEQAPKLSKQEKIEPLKAKVEVPKVSKEVEVKEAKISFADRLTKGLSKTSQGVFGKLSSLFGKGLDSDTLDEVEELLYSADMGPATVSEIIEALQEKVKKGEFGPDDFKKFMYEFLKSKMQDVQKNVSDELFTFKGGRGTRVIMVVGVNGAGKTTTIGKLATKLTAQGAKVVVGACDTFRAAAVDQLQVWCDRSGATMVRAKEGANPSGVGYDALQTALNEKADYCILDTAGRLHTAGNLMDELKKSKTVLQKLDETAPHHTLLVIDAITGQNALRQAEEFNKTLALTGLILTKCDGSSKAGSAVSIVSTLQVPITYIGIGESVDDLDQFKLEEYLKALLAL